MSASTAGDAPDRGDPDRPLADVPLCPAGERRRIADLGRGAPLPRPYRACIHELVAAAAARTPEARAVDDITYRELVTRAWRLAYALRAEGVVPGVRVGVCLDRTAELVVVLLAVLAAGGCYVPLDPTYPADRLAYTAGDAGLHLVVVPEDTAPAGLAAVRTVTPAGLAGAAAGAPAGPPGSGAGPDDPAYVIYTSGTTGRPKGVVIPHRNVAALVAATAPGFGLRPHDVWTWFHSAAFDVSVWEIWGALATGGRLVVVPYWTCRSPEDFRALLATQRVTVLSQTPSTFARLCETTGAPLAVRLVVLAGEPLDPARLIGWFDTQPACQVVNMYGITETTVHVTATVVTRADALAGSRSVGRAIPGWSVRVVDEGGWVVPLGDPGEIAVGGAGLADGYLNRPGLTAARFVPDPDTGELLYRSGDRGRMRPDGSVEYLGRLDDQVKLRGHRIELDEVRIVLLGHPAVRAATVVLHRPDGDPDAARLIAYLTPAGVDATEVRRHAAAMLPEYMVPGQFVVLDALPLTANGKVDTRRLPVPDAAPAAGDGPAGDGPAGSGPLATVLGVWRDLLHPGTGEGDDFFDLGGNSMLALRVARGMRERGLPVEVRELYTLRTPRRIAEHLSSGPA